MASMSFSVPLSACFQNRVHFLHNYPIIRTIIADWRMDSNRFHTFFINSRRKINHLPGRFPSRKVIGSYISSRIHTAWQDIPSPSPVKPRCSSVVAFTLMQFRDTPKASEMLFSITGI